MRVRTCAPYSGRTSHGDLCGVFSNHSVDIFHCTLGMSCSREDGAVVLGEDVQPGRDVGIAVTVGSSGMFRVRLVKTSYQYQARRLAIRVSELLMNCRF